VAISARDVATANTETKNQSWAGGSGARRRARQTAVALVVIIIASLTWGLLTLPWQAMIILGVASIVAFFAWLNTSYRYPVRSKRVVAAYLVAVAFQFIHMSEEYAGHFPHEFVLLFHTNHDWTEKSFLLTFVFGFGALWLLAGAGALYRIRIANYFLWFYALGAGLINAISHFVFPIINGWHYFPGVYTAAGHLFFSALVLRFLLLDARTQRRKEAIPASEDLNSMTL
jgi:hypothetical protein